MTITDPLALQIADACLLRGTFTLRSGRTSSYYLDKYAFSTRPQLLDAVGDRLAETLSKVAPDATRLAGAELGGIPLVTVAGLRTGKPLVFVRNAKKDYGTAKQLEGTIEAGDVIPFLEDVCTSGGQAIEACHALREAGATVPAIIAVIDRQEGAREAIEAEGLAFHALFTKTDLGVDE